jgi:DNA-binding transcriptional LysR family regulator
MQDELICREFQETLKRMKIDWRPRIEAGSLDLVEQYVQKGYGIGLAVRVPGSRLPPKIRALDLPDFPVLTLGMLWRDDQNKLLRAFREQIQARSRQIAS